VQDEHRLPLRALEPDDQGSDRQTLSL
jgi:hypothetical protein